MLEILRIVPMLLARRGLKEKDRKRLEDAGQMGLFETARPVKGHVRKTETGKLVAVKPHLRKVEVKEPTPEPATEAPDLEAEGPDLEPYQLGGAWVTGPIWEAMGEPRPDRGGFPRHIARHDNDPERLSRKERQAMYADGESATAWRAATKKDSPEVWRERILELLEADPEPKSFNHLALELTQREYTADVLLGTNADQALWDLVEQRKLAMVHDGSALVYALPTAYKDDAGWHSGTEGPVADPATTPTEADADALVKRYNADEADDGDLDAFPDQDLLERAFARVEATRARAEPEPATLDAAEVLRWKAGDLKAGLETYGPADRAVIHAELIRREGVRARKAAERVVAAYEALGGPTSTRESSVRRWLELTTQTEDALQGMVADGHDMTAHLERVQAEKARGLKQIEEFHALRARLREDPDFRADVEGAPKRSGVAAEYESARVANEIGRQEAELDSLTPREAMRRLNEWHAERGSTNLPARLKLEAEAGDPVAARLREIMERPEVNTEASAGVDVVENIRVPGMPHPDDRDAEAMRRLEANSAAEGAARDAIRNAPGTLDPGQVARWSKKRLERELRGARGSIPDADVNVIRAELDKRQRLADYYGPINRPKPGQVPTTPGAHRMVGVGTNVLTADERRQRTANRGKKRIAFAVERAEGPVAPDIAAATLDLRGSYHFDAMASVMRGDSPIDKATASALVDRGLVQPFEDWQLARDETRQAAGTALFYGFEPTPKGKMVGAQVLRLNQVPDGHPAHGVPVGEYKKRTLAEWREAAGRPHPPEPAPPEPAPTRPRGRRRSPKLPSVPHPDATLSPKDAAKLAKQLRERGRKLVEANTDDATRFGRENTNKRRQQGADRRRDAGNRVAWGQRMQRFADMIEAGHQPTQHEKLLATQQWRSAAWRQWRRHYNRATGEWSTPKPKPAKVNPTYDEGGVSSWSAKWKGHEDAVKAYHDALDRLKLQHGDADGFIPVTGELYAKVKGIEAELKKRTGKLPAKSDRPSEAMADKLRMGHTSPEGYVEAFDRTQRFMDMTEPGSPLKVSRHQPPDRSGARAPREQRMAQADRDEAAAYKDPEHAHVPGYFPTPATTVERMKDALQLRPGMSVLEPSAGSGGIADRLPADVDITVAEYNHGLRDVLRAKGYNPQHDALKIPGRFDRIIMNPPFEQQQDIEHVMHAFENNLAPGGRLVAVVSSGALRSQRGKGPAFQALLERHGDGGWAVDPKKWRNSGTSVNAEVVVLQKPARLHKARRWRVVASL